MQWMQLKCCGYSGILDYNNTVGTAWTPRRPGVLAPASCCKGVGGNIDKPDLENEELQQCYRFGTSLNEYNQKVSHIFSTALTSTYNLPLMIRISNLLGHKLG